MEWTNESVLEFIELLHAEPSIWNHRVKNHKNRALVTESWIRIKNNFSLPCTVADLKRKRNSLLTQYRDILKKIKESQQTTSDGHDIYKPTWFAFDAMNSYLKHLYDGPVTVKSEEIMVTYDEDPLSNESDSYNDVHPSCEIEANNKRATSWESNSRKISYSRRLSRDSNTPSEPDTFVFKKGRRMQELATKQMNVPIPNEKSYREAAETAVRECDLYGQLIAEKLKSLEQNDRLTLMNAIDNLVFNYLMTVRKQKASQYNLTDSQPIHLPGPSTQIP